MHRTLTQDTTQRTLQQRQLRAQQKRFDEFRRVYNYERPHEALNATRRREAFMLRAHGYCHATQRRMSILLIFRRDG
jgi:threonyl-tRNA synthetase